ncbi:MAG: element excision factor XisI family protein [Bacteroidota bacterium]
MDRIEKYQQIIREELQYQLELGYSDMPNIKYKLIEDGFQFIVLAVGWHEKEYIHDLWFHLEIIEDKVWIFENNTDYQLGKALTTKGMAKDDILVAWLDRGENTYTKALAA